MSDLIKLLQAKAYALRVASIKATTAVGSGHVTSSLSAADIVAALFFYAMRFDSTNPKNRTNDRFILSKGHAVPVLYAAWKELGVISEEECLSLRRFDSVFEGHPTARFVYNDAATGSLGCGLSIGLGMALAGRMQEKPFHTYVMLGDSEMTEGSVWEAIELAAWYEVGNLTAIVDLNGLGQSTRTIDDHHLQKHADRWQAFGWEALCINGHTMSEIIAALDYARNASDKPVVIIAKTIKGYGIDEMENQSGFHGKVVPKKDLERVLALMKKRFSVEAAEYREPTTVPRYEPSASLPISVKIIPSFKKDTRIATRKAFGEALAQAGEDNERIVSLDAEVKNSTYAELFEKRFPNRFIQCFIAEQNMIGMAIGLEARGYIPVSSTFASFITRAHDQIRMGVIGGAALRIVGSHAGVSIGEDGPSQMGLEDIALMRSLPDSIVLYPSDGVSTYALLALMLEYQKGMSYLRLTRAETPILYDASTTFHLGGFHVLRGSSHDQLCIVAAGITVHEALLAYEDLKKQGIFVSVIDLYCIKPLGQEALLTQLRRSGNKLITVEDHYLEGGLGEALCFALINEGIVIECLAVKELSRSGTPQQLLAFHRIDRTAIVDTALTMLSSYEGR